MPPVRWKSISVISLISLVQAAIIFSANGQLMQDSISMTSDGWRPIVGTRKEPPIMYNNYLNTEYRTQPIYTSTTPISPLPPQTIPPTRISTKQPIRHNNNNGANKIPQHGKLLGMNPFYGLTSHGSHGPVIPLSSVTHGRPGQSGQIKKYPSSNNKPFNQNKRHNNKPVRVQTTNHGNREEMFTASASSGAFPMFNKGINNNKVKTRETVGLGLPPGAANHYSINQPHAHIEFNRFAVPPTSESVFQHFNSPLQGFIFPKHPQINDINANFQFQKQNNDEFIRNLAPPLQRGHFKHDSNNKIKEVTEKNQILLKQNIPEKVIVQLPPPFQYSQPHNPQESIQITKEKLNVFRNNIPENYKGDYVDYDFHNVKIPTEFANKHQTYEVTEGKTWEETPQYIPPPRRRNKPNITPPPKKRQELELNFPPFLPTPYSSEGQGVVPTSPTQSEVSTIFTKLSNKQKEYINTQNPLFAYNIKEVSTHFPILGKPLFEYEQQTPEITNDITTTSMPTTRTPQHRRRRPSHRLRTTSTTSTTPEPVAEMDAYDLQKMQEYESTQSAETEKPVRQRRPSHRYRATTTLAPVAASPEEEEEIPMVKVSRVRGRYKLRQPNNDFEEPSKKRRRPIKVAPAPPATEMPQNHKMVSNSDESELQTTEAMSRESNEADEEDSAEKATETLTKVVKYELEIPKRDYDLEKQIRYNIFTPIIEKITTTERIPTTIPFEPEIPENEIESVAVSTEYSEEETVPTTTTTTVAPTSASTTVKSTRIRGRPIKYDNSNRPRFSVKDYRQKFSSSSTTESSRVSETPKPRVSIRLRRPTSTASAVTNNEEVTESNRSRFTPKDPRHHGPTTESSGNEAIITEKNVKAVNTRLRPFGRYRSTSATTTTTPRVSIKPNLFSARRRPTMVSLRNKIMSRNKVNSTDVVTTTEENEAKETTLSYNEEIDEETTTESVKKVKVDATTTTAVEDDVEEATSAEMVKNESVIYSQRVSDLTSSSQNEYNTPGLFKNVSPTSRRIPNYFTIATDDPILPIEAFFPNIKDKA